MREIRKLPKEEVTKLKKNKWVESVDEHLVILTLEFHVELYRRWKELPDAYIIRRTLKEQDIDPKVLGDLYVEAIIWDFQTFGDPAKRPYGSKKAPHQPTERRNDVVLLSTGCFYATNSSFKWEPGFRREIREHYPEMSIEACIAQAGINPCLVGNERIRTLKRHFDKETEQKQRAIENAERQNGDPVSAEQDGSYRYILNPYVEEVIGKNQLTMKDIFYNEAYYLETLPMEELLAIYGIDASVLSASCVAGIRSIRYDWKPTGARITDWTEEVCRIQKERLRAMIKCTERGFLRIRETAKALSAAQKRVLCLQISEYPTRSQFSCGYSRREILQKSGLSKTLYYKALFDKGYGLAAERRMNRDKRDLEKVLYVMGYKGFEKGIRQIYMLMPDLTGEVFAVSKIRRLLRQAGVKTKIRKENPARQRMGEFLERNRKPDLLKREFRLHRPNEVRLTDVTYLDYGKGEEKQRAYGSSCIDPVTGKLLVFHVAQNNDLELALTTLEKLSAHPSVEGVLFHSDQGILYFTDEFQEKVAGMGMVQSMSKRGNCWDNAPQESFFGHFKDECRYGSCENFGQLQSMIDEYAWYYNNERHQWDRNQMTPVQYEEHLLSMDEEAFAEYMKSEQEKYDRMKEKAKEKALERAKTLGV